MEGTIAEIRYFAGNFSPKNWAYCQGQLLSIASNTALFSILGTYYGGDGRTTFGLPDFRGRVAVGVGQGAGLSGYVVGEMTGTESFTITSNTFPAHTHSVVGSVVMNATALDGNADSPQNTYPALQTGTQMYASANNASTIGAVQHNLGTSATGSNLPVSNLQPVIGMNFIICMYGVFPARN